MAGVCLGRILRDGMGIIRWVFGYLWIFNMPAPLQCRRRLRPASCDPLFDLKLDKAIRGRKNSVARISRLAKDYSPSVAAALSPDVLVRQPPGTVSMLFHKVPVLQVPRAWRWAPLDLHLDVELRPANDGAVAIHAPMRAGITAKLFGPKVRKMGILPDDVAAVVLLKLQEGAHLRARIIDAPPPRLRTGRMDMGIFLSIRCKA